MMEARKTPRGVLELIGLTAIAFVLANGLLVDAGMRDASWFALFIELLFGPLANLLIGGAAIAALHWGPGRRLSAHSRRLCTVGVVCAILTSIVVDIVLIDTVPKHGC